jgi:hypothetical protein
MVVQFLSRISYVPPFPPGCRPEFRFTVDSKRRPGGKKDPTRHTKRLIFDLRFCPRSLRISIVWARQADFAKILLLAQRLRDSLRHDGMPGVLSCISKRKPRKTALELSSKFFCSDNFISPSSVDETTSRVFGHACPYFRLLGKFSI